MVHNLHFVVAIMHQSLLTIYNRSILFHEVIQYSMKSVYATTILISAWVCLQRVNIFDWLFIQMYLEYSSI